jgi:hypothetical protein
LTRRYPTPLFIKKQTNKAKENKTKKNQKTNKNKHEESKRRKTRKTRSKEEYCGKHLFFHTARDTDENEGANDERRVVTRIVPTPSLSKQKNDPLSRDCSEN